MIVLKFGGTSMGSTPALKKVSEIIHEKIKKQENPIIVCSAMSNTTDNLLKIGNLAENWKTQEALTLLNELKQKHFEIAKKLNILENFQKQTTTIFENLENMVKGIGLIHELSDRSLAYLVSFGEKLSTRLLTELLKSKNLPAKQIDSTFIKTQGLNFCEDEIHWQKTEKEIDLHLKPEIKKGNIPIITGFFGTNGKKIISLLGRGGSDFSGAILTVCLKAKKLEIWTDVDGFLSADPRIVKDAQIINEIGFKEVSELCFFGAKVLHPKTIRPVIEKGGEVWIKNTFSPEKNGTKITKKAQKNPNAVVSISSKKVAMISLDIFATGKKKTQIYDELFSLAHRKDIFIDMIASSEAEISFCIEEKYLEKEPFFEALKKIIPSEISKNRTIICIVSPEDVKGQIGIATKIFQAISESKISVEMYTQNASEIAQLIVVKSKDAKHVIAKIHEKLVKNKKPLITL